MKLYLDIFFAVNFLMNLLIFELMNLCLKRKPVSKRSILAAAAGALAAVALVVTGIKDYAALYIFMYLFVSCLLIRIAYGKMTVPGMGRHIAGFYITGVFTAGVLLFLKGITGVRNISMLFLLGAACLILFAAPNIISAGSQGIRSRKNLYPVKIVYNGKSVTGTGFLDTGNHLYEPVSRERVTVVEYNLFQNVLSEQEKADLKRAIHQKEPEMFGTLLLRYIPFHSLGKDSDYLPGVRVDDMEIQTDGGEQIHTGKTWLGICDQFLSADSGYEMLLNSGLFRK